MKTQTAFTDLVEALEASILSDSLVAFECPFWTSIDTEAMTLMGNVETARDFGMRDGFRRLEGIFRGEWFRLDISTQY
jgi:hypothetical protein